MGRYVDLIRDLERAEPSRGTTCDRSDQSDKYGVRSLLSLMSQSEDRAIVVAECPPRPKVLTEAASADPQWWRDEYAERAAHRESGGNYPRAEAEVLVWGELENRWNLAEGERVSRDLCAGCRRPIGAEAALDLMDGNRVHDRAEHDCLIRHGKRWRGAATRALIAMGLEAPCGSINPEVPSVDSAGRASQQGRL